MLDTSDKRCFIVFAPDKELREEFFDLVNEGYAEELTHKQYDDIMIAFEEFVEDEKEYYELNKIFEELKDRVIK